jgi:hypothetical protein
MQAVTATPTVTNRIRPAVERDTEARNPTATRYGWNPFRPINLAGPDGTMTYVVQPERITAGEFDIPNPYHRELPTRQLIPFVTFSYTKMIPTAANDPNSGRALLRPEREVVTALDAITAILYGYSAHGFTILNSLEGVEDQDLANRVFQVVQPLAYPLGRMVEELETNVDARIESREPLIFAEFPDYSVEPLRSEAERDLARVLASELAAGANQAVIRANDILDETEASMTQKFSGGMGKSGPDELDKILSAELGRDLPKLVGKGAQDRQPDAAIQRIESKVDRVVEQNEMRELREQNEKMQAELAALRAGQNQVPQDVLVCGRPKADGTPCQTRTGGGPCANHKE